MTGFFFPLGYILTVPFCIFILSNIQVLSEIEENILSLIL